MASASQELCHYKPVSCSKDMTCQSNVEDLTWEITELVHVAISLESRIDISENKIKETFNFIVFR